MFPLVVANWKMNPLSVREAKKVYTDIKAGIRTIKGVEVVVCPPVIFLPELAKEKRSVRMTLGVQDLSSEEQGAYTGQIASAMVLEYKATWAILGHSERRALGETNEVVAQKVLHTIQKGLSPLLCVGESERNDEGAHYTFVRAQLEAVFAVLKRKDIEKLTVAYEPVWAIGKHAEDAMQSPQLFEMALYIRKLLIERYGRKIADHVRVLYGGSVKSDNVTDIVREGGVDGVLVGSASLNAQEFCTVVAKVAGVQTRVSNGALRMGV